MTPQAAHTSPAQPEAPIDTLKPFGALIQRLIQKEDLTRAETYHGFSEVLEDRQPDLQQGAFLAALAAKGETAEEIAGAWQAIDELDTVHVELDAGSAAVENSGTGMDSLKTFNVSTAAAVVAAACGVPMARHGARALTSAAGTVDVAEAMGVDVECPVEVVRTSIAQAGIGLFNGMSPRVHPRALGRILSQIRFGSTLNISASLANPARPYLGVRGVWSREMVRTTAEVMRGIGYTRGMVVHGLDAESGRGMDEVSPCGPTTICAFGSEGVREFELEPEEAGLVSRPFAEISTLGGPEAESARLVRVLSPGEKNGLSGCADFTCLNAAAVLVVAGQAGGFAEGVAMAREVIESGSAVGKLQEWVEVQRGEDSNGPDRLRNLLVRV